MSRRLPEARWDFARCRVLRHSWEVAGQTEANGSKLIVLECLSCRSTRYDRWNTRTGERWGKPSYVYATGYQDRDPGHDPDWWRKVYAEQMYSIGVFTDPPLADSIPKAKLRIGIKKKRA